MVSKTPLYNWRQKYAGIDSSHIRELKALQDENRRLKQLYAELMLAHQLAKHIIEKSCKALSKTRVGRIVVWEQSVSVVRACRVLHLQRSLWYYRRARMIVLSSASSVYWLKVFLPEALISIMLSFEMMAINGLEAGCCACTLR